MNEFQFGGLMVLDIANNHLGDVKHGQKIISELGKVCKSTGIRGAIKFQFRNIDTFIHPDYKDKKDVKHLPWFISTYLDKSGYKKLIKEIKKQNMVSISTPFDEESVDQILDLDIEVIKIASCCVTDRPLLKKIAKAGKPVIASTAGAKISEIDDLVQLLESNKITFALHHCVAIYPTPNDQLNLNQITLLKKRYNNITIGWSTHESPDDYEIIKMAYAMGARLFERHVGLKKKGSPLNAYSSQPFQVKNWFNAYKDAVVSCGPEHRPPAPIQETESLLSLMRGVYAKKSIKKGQVIKRNDVFFAMPLQDGSLKSGQWRSKIISNKNYKANEFIEDILADFKRSKDQIIHDIMLQVKGILNDGRISIGKKSQIEISHHYGLNRFREFGAVIIDVVNRSYCKKLIIQLPRQKHPYHYHKRKEETFQVLYGDLEVETNGVATNLGVGDLFLVKPNTWHKFHTLHGVIFEEISTKHYNDDSFYEDSKISRLKRETRKTIIDNWESMP